VLDVGIHNDRPYVVMDFVSGQNLRDLIAHGPQPIPRAAEIVRQVLSGLAHAHELGIIHRDIKPANIVLSQKTGLGDHVKILDFGLARLAESGKTSQNLTSGIVVGTPAYMAPEQIRGDKLDQRADLYACGVLLYELLTGEKPFHSENDDPIEVCRMHLNAPIPRLDAKLPGGDFGELETVVRTVLAKRADDRYASAQELAAALDAVVPRRTSSQPLTPVPRSGPIRMTSTPIPTIPPTRTPPAGSPVARSRVPGDESSVALEIQTADVLTAMDDEPSPSGPSAPRAPAPPAPRASRERSADDGSAPGTFLGLTVGASGPSAPSASSGSSGLFGSSGSSGLFGSSGAPRPRADRDDSASEAHPRRRRWPWIAALAAVVLAGGAAAALVLSGGTSSSDGESGASSANPGDPGDPGREIAQRATQMAAQGEREAALDLLVRSRKQYPSSAPLAYAAGRILFSKFYWTDGLKSFRDAIRNEPRYRTDPELIKTVLRGFITTPGYNDELAAFLRDDIGAAAQPFLEETARDHPSAAIRSRAANELRRYR
ncbi:MAG TPA: serine/threonine-protein kinase, partial [Kofleriaceae bacterium]|nr:serine/threonine-protein kinase [Kofleriaceae bacterium]